jgi:hypothetical protein
MQPFGFLGTPLLIIFQSYNKELRRHSAVGIHVCSCKPWCLTHWEISAEL